MYDDKYNFLSPGVFGAVREIEYTNKIRKDFDDQMKYYYMGYYIQDCVKSVYKGEYYPSELLCPETYTWVPLESIREKIDQHGYCRYAEDGVETIEEMRISEDDKEKYVSTFFFFFKDYQSILPMEMVNPEVASSISEAMKGKDNLNEFFKRTGSLEYSKGGKRKL